MFKRLFIAIILLALIVGGIVWFDGFRAQKIAEFLSSNAPPPVPVTTEVVEPVTWTPGIEAIGTASATQGVDLSVESGGVVREVLFTGNDHISRGQHLIQIDDDSERAALAAANAALRVAVADSNRAHTLSERGVNAAVTVESAEAQVESAKAQVTQIQTSLDHKRTVAPFEGVIGIPRIEVGEFVSTGMVFATLQDLSRMRVDFSVPEQQIGHLARGGPVVVTSEVGNLRAEGRITAIEPRIDPNSRLISVRAEVENADRAIVPGQFLRVRIIQPSEEGIIAVPQTAIDSSLYGDSIFVLKPSDDDDAEGVFKAEQVFVKIGRRSDALIEVTDGLSTGDQIVTSGQNRLISGARVTVDNSVRLDVTVSDETAPDDGAPDEAADADGSPDTSPEEDGAAPDTAPDDTDADAQETGE